MRRTIYLLLLAGLWLTGISAAVWWLDGFVSGEDRMAWLLVVGMQVAAFATVSLVEEFAALHVQCRRRPDLFYTSHGAAAYGITQSFSSPED